jgi:hypothetical protein
MSHKARNLDIFEAVWRTVIIVLCFPLICVRIRTVDPLRTADQLEDISRRPDIGMSDPSVIGTWLQRHRLLLVDSFLYTLSLIGSNTLLIMQMLGKCYHTLKEALVA